MPSTQLSVAQTSDADQTWLLTTKEGNVQHRFEVDEAELIRHYIELRRLLSGRASKGQTNGNFHPRKV